MTDQEKIAILKFAIEVLATADMGEPSLYAETYQSEVKEIARKALSDISDTTPQD